MAWFSFRRSIFRLMSTSNRPKVVLDKQIEEKLNALEIKARKHPGKFDPGVVRLPNTFIEAANKIVSGKSIKDLEKQAAVLDNHLRFKRPPLSETDVEVIESLVSQKVVYEQSKRKIEDVPPEERQAILESQKERTKKLTKQFSYKWRAVNYNESNAILYLIARAAADYASLVRVLGEISSRDKDFQPESLFDFGSGIGLVSWAVTSVWQKQPKEMFCVDPSADMNKLALALLQGGKQNDSPDLQDTDSVIPGLYFRQFMPTSAAIKFDLVVCAHTLLELPSAETRLQTALNLWRKSANYLVFVEHGSKAAYEVLMEIRDFILSLSEQEPTLKGHIFAPCPHESSCPLLDDRIPCNFEVSYENILPRKRDQIAKERFSYLVFKKGNHPPSDPQWPRVVRPVLRPSRQTICRLCTKRGKFEEVIFTRSKYDLLTSQCAKKTSWGDLLPVHLKESDREEDASVPEENEHENHEK